MRLILLKIREILSEMAWILLKIGWNFPNKYGMKFP